MQWNDPAPLDTLTMRGCAAARSRGRNACVTRIGPKTLIANPSIAASAVNSSAASRGAAVPALLIRTSRRPKSLRTRAAAARVRNEYGHLDVLINNAGTAAPRLGAEELTAEAAMEGFAINVFGPIRMTHAFLPLLRAAEHPRIVNVSSGVGSFQRILEPGTVENTVTLPVYPATKAALTMLTVQYARALHGILVNAADPGFTSTDFNNHRGTQNVTEGTDAIVRLATLTPDGPTGTFQDRHGPVPW